MVAVALAARIGFVCWAPGGVSGDAFWYHFYALQILGGAGYSYLDGSPVVVWMPGWSLLLAGLYAALGPDPHFGMFANAALGAATAGLLVWLGARLFRPAIGLVAGALYAAWPGNVYYAATLMTESAFNFALVLCLALLARGVEAGGRVRDAWLFAAGLAFGLATLIRSEPLALTPVLLLFLACSLRPPRQALRAAGGLLLALGLVLAPWVVRNYQAFDRVLVTAASGGANAWLGNHRGASGGELLPHALEYAKRHRGASHAESVLAANDAGWREAWDFVREHPAEELRILARKLRLSYGSDSGAIPLLRGAGTGAGTFLERQPARRLARLADAWWFAMLALAALGLATLRGFRAAARVLVLGWLGSWLAVQLVFLGGPRFHVPMTPALALLAALGLDVLRRAVTAPAQEPASR